MPDDVTPAVLLGVREEENPYLAEGGAWKARCVSAFLRRYPFVFSGACDAFTAPP